MTLATAQIETVRRSLTFDNARAWLLLIATVILLGVVYMGQASQAAITGQRINDKQEKLDRILRENAQLEADIAALTTPSRIEARARALGLQLPNPDQIKYLAVKDYPTEPVNPAVADRERLAVPKASSAFDLTAWWTDVLSRVGLNGGARAAEATTNP